MCLRSLNIACNFSISTILVPIVQERQNQATVCFGLLTLLLNATDLCTSSCLDSNQRCTSAKTIESIELLIYQTNFCFSKLLIYCPMLKKSIEHISSFFNDMCVTSNLLANRFAGNLKIWLKTSKTRNREFSCHLVRMSWFWCGNTLPNETICLKISIIITK